MVPAADVDPDSPLVVQLIEAVSRDPWITLGTALLGLIAAIAFLIAVTKAMSRAGTWQPPVTSLTVVTGLVAMLAILAAVLRPEVEALTVAAGTAVGALAGALGVAFNREAEDWRAHRQEQHREEPPDDDADDTSSAEAQE